MTVADMEKLEHAARLSMGGLADAEIPAAASQHVHYVRFIGLALVLLAALTIALKLL